MARSRESWQVAVCDGLRTDGARGDRCDVGGSFILVDRRDGEDVEHVGEYLEIDRPRRLAFTFAVPKFSKESTRVTIGIIATETGCELTLIHEGILPEYASRTETGWNGILDGLATTLGQA